MKRSGFFARGPIDAWIQRQREFVMRLPKWLVGTTMVSVAALGLWQAVYDKGLMPLLSRLYSVHSPYPAFGTVAFTMLAGFAALYVIARVIKPPAPTNLPAARVND